MKYNAKPASSESPAAFIKVLVVAVLFVGFVRYYRTAGCCWNAAAISRLVVAEVVTVTGLAVTVMVVLVVIVLESNDHSNDEF